MASSSSLRSQPDDRQMELLTKTVVDLDVGGIHYTTLKATLLGHNLQAGSGSQHSRREGTAAQPLTPKGSPVPFASENGNAQADGPLRSTANSINTDTDGNHRSIFHDIFGNGNYPASVVKSTAQPGPDSLTQGPGGGLIFLDRDGPLFRYVLQYLRTGQLVLPTNFDEYGMLMVEAEYYRLPQLVALVSGRKPALKGMGSQLNSETQSLADSEVASSNNLTAVDEATAVNTYPLAVGALGTTGLTRNPAATGYLTVGYRGTFAFGRDGQADVKFRKMSRILVCGRVNLCREVFGDTLNESRDPDRGHYERYSSRFFLKHNFLEQAFDDLQRARFHCVGSCGTSTASSCKVDVGKPAQDNEENKWNHYNEFVFCRP